MGTQYNTLISILFVGYIAGQIPSNMILSRVRPSWYLGGEFSSVCVHRLCVGANVIARVLHGLVDYVSVHVLGE